MALFRYTAVNASGKVVKGTMEAADRAAVVDRLHAERQLPLDAVPAGMSRGIWALLNSDVAANRGITRRELADFTRELAVMLGAGQDLDHALRFVVETTRGARAREIFAAIRDKVRGGGALASALVDHTASFPRLYVGMVRAGEAGGTLAETLERLAELLTREQSLRANIQSALIYPALLLAAAIGTIVLLLVYVLPQFTPIFEQAGAKLPAATRFLIDFGAAVQQYGLVAALVVGGIVLSVRQIARQPGPGLAFDQLQLAVPVLGELIRQTQAARLTRTLGALLGNGVGLLAALGIVREVLGNRAAVKLIDQATGSVKEGAGLARALAAGRVFPARMIDLLRLGEETGRLPGMALRAAEIHEEQVRLMVQRLVGLMVPVITVVTGLGVAGIIASLVVAMLSLNDLAM
jgi:general secretion pathway protein F